MTERQSIVAYLKTQKVPNPDNPADDFTNGFVDHLIRQIESGAHRVVEQKRTRR